MDFIEQVKRTASGVAHTVAEKSGEIMEISKIKYAVYDLNNDIKKLYTEIGKLVYEELRGDQVLTEDMQIKCEIIEAKKAKIAALLAKEKKVRHGVTCPVCGQECENNTNFCSHCGAELAVKVEAEVPHVVIRDEKDASVLRDTAEQAENVQEEQV